MVECYFYHSYDSFEQKCASPFVKYRMSNTFLERYYYASFKHLLSDFLHQVLMPVEGLDIERGQILLHHAIAVSMSEINLLDALQDQVVSNALETHD